MPPEFWHNNDINSSLEKDSKLILSPEEKSKKKEQKAKKNIEDRKVENEKYKKKIEKYKSEIKSEFDKNNKYELAKVEFEESNNILNWFEKKLDKVWEQRKNAIEEIKKGTKSKLALAVKEFSDDIWGITKIFENKDLFWNSYKTLTALLRKPENNNLWEKVYDLFRNGNIVELLKKYNSLKWWTFEIKDINDIIFLIKMRPWHNGCVLGFNPRLDFQSSYASSILVGRSN